MYWTNLSNRVIGIWGMGREGQAVRQALENHCSNIEILEIGEDNTDEILNCSVLIKSPGVSLYRPEIQQALQRGITITSGTNIYFSNKKRTVRVIAVTGTKGKSTTSSLLAHTLKFFGKQVRLGGNIGIPLVSLVDEMADIVVAELSSYQCADLTGEPDIGILTNLYPEHLQWHQSHQKYYSDKVRLVSLSKQVVLNAKDEQTKGFYVPSDVLWFNGEQGIHVRDNYFFDGERSLFPVSKLNLMGMHNAENACAVLTVIKKMGFPVDKCAEPFSTFKSLPHRLQIIGEKDGITYVDDSISTTPETAVAGLKALDKGQDITLIAGGLDRGQDYTCLVDYLTKYKDRMRLVTLPDTGERLASQAQMKGVETSPTSDMPTAVSVAQHLTPAGGMILLSPAAPSYNMYHNFEERGLDFKHWTGLK